MSIKTWWSKITGAANNEDQFSVQQITYLGKAANATTLFPFGFYANIDNDSLGFVGAVGNSTESKVIIAFSPKIRPTLEQGEVAIYRPSGDAVIKFASSGNIEISTTEDVTVNCKNATVTATENINLTATGDITLTGENITLDASVKATINGGPEVDINGTAINLN